jgi:subtilisin family serine protease
MQHADGTLRHTYTDAIKGFSAQLPPQAVEALMKNPQIVSVTPDIVGTEAGSPQINMGWGLDRVDQMSRSLNATYYYDNTGAGVDIYILDSGISQSHSEFTGRIKKWHETISNSNSVEDCHGHGSSVASIAAGTNYGVAKGDWIIPVRINDCDGEITLSDAIAVIGAGYRRGERVRLGVDAELMLFRVPFDRVTREWEQAQVLRTISTEREHEWRTGLALRLAIERVLR